MERLTDREIEIMLVIWSKQGDETWTDGKIPTGEILAGLKLTYAKRYLQPVQVVLRRLCKKGVLECEKIRNVNYYRPLINEEEYRKFETGIFIDRLYGSNARNLVLSLVKYEQLSDDDVKELHDREGEETKK